MPCKGVLCCAPTAQSHCVVLSSLRTQETYPDLCKHFQSLVSTNECGDCTLYITYICARARACTKASSFKAYVLVLLSAFCEMNVSPLTFPGLQHLNVRFVLVCHSVCLNTVPQCGLQDHGCLLSGCECSRAMNLLWGGPKPVTATHASGDTSLFS